MTGRVGSAGRLYAPNMGRAERAAAARARLERIETERRQHEQSTRAATELEVRCQQIEPLRLQALGALRSAGWPDGVLIKPYGSFLKRKKAGWLVGEILTSMHGEPGSRPIYLLSNGQWSAPDDYEVSTRELLKTRRISGIEDGLQRLIEKYG